jgi:hypothetical protein
MRPLNSLYGRYTGDHVVILMTGTDRSYEDAMAAVDHFSRADKDKHLSPQGTGSGVTP